MDGNENKKKKLPPTQGPVALLLLLGLTFGAVAYLLWYNSVNHESKVISYSNFVRFVEEDKVEKIMVQDSHVQGKMKNQEVVFETDIIPAQSLWDTLQKHKVDVVVKPIERDHTSWGSALGLGLLLTLIGLLAVFYFRQNQSNNSGGGAGKIFSVGKSKARFFSPNTVNVSFKDVAGIDEVKEDLQDIIKFLKDPEHFGRLGAKIPRGVLLSGAPGNGKTLLAKAVAGEASCPFFSISGSDFVEVFVGVGASRVRDLFVQARKHAPCIVFIDEIDAVGRQRGVGLGGGNDEREQTLNQLLSEMDGFSTEHGAVIILAATNRPDVLDNALLRPGRFDRIIEVPYPDLSSREKILQVHSKKVKLSDSIDLKRVARGTPGFSGADLENLVNEAALVASKANKDVVEMDDFESARDKLLLGSTRKSMVLSEKEKQRTAYHESGHALLNVLLPDTDPLHKVSIIPRGRALGVSSSLPEEDRYIESKQRMLAKIMVSMGGLLAEKIVFNDQTTGAASDIEFATKLARRMVCRYGMSRLGPIVFGTNQDHPYLGRDLMSPSADYSAETARKIDEEINHIVQECLAKAEELLGKNREKLDILSKALLEKEIVTAQQVYELLGIEPRVNHSLVGEEPSTATGDAAPAADGQTGDNGGGE